MDENRQITPEQMKIIQERLSSWRETKEVIEAKERLENFCQEIEKQYKRKNSFWYKSKRWALMFLFSLPIPVYLGVEYGLFIQMLWLSAPIYYALVPMLVEKIERKF